MAPQPPASSVRYFVGVAPPAGLSTRLGALMGELGDPWPVPHITLRSPPGLSPDVRWLGDVRAVAHAHAPFVVELDGLCAFAGRVLYLDVRAPSLVSIHDQLAKLLPEPPASSGRSETGRRFVPHLTLAVARARRPLPLMASVSGRLGPLPPFRVDDLVVFRRPRPSLGYEAWRRFELRGAP